MPNLKTQQYIEERVERVPFSGCWIWTLALNVYGQPFAHINKKQSIAYRTSYEAFIGPIPEGAHVLHRCDTPCCCNPHHLFLGTHLDNMKDRDTKGRQPRGESHGMSKLTADVARMIYADTRNGRLIAAEFGISKTAVNSIRRGRTWAHATNHQAA
jgi:hypothetical protein